MFDENRIVLMGGGTFNYVRAHFAVATPAFGQTVNKLEEMFLRYINPKMPLVVDTVRTKMASGSSSIVTNDDVEKALIEILDDPTVKALIFNVALCDFDAQVGDIPSSKTAPRLQSRGGDLTVQLTPSKKLINIVKERRPDVFLVGFKTTSNEDTQTQLDKARRQIEETGADLVVANDIGTLKNFLVSENGVIDADRDTILLEVVHTVIRASL